MNLNEVNKAVIDIFSAKRILAETIAKNNNQKAENLPAYTKLKAIEKELSFELAKQSSASKKNTKKIADLKKNLKFTRDEEKKLLSQIGLKPSDLLAKYECKICSDKGFVDGKMCSCFKSERNRLLVKEFGLNENELSSFSEVNLSLCDDNSQAESLKKLTTLLSSWCESYPAVKKKNLILCGATGVGKTYLSKCMAKSLIEKGNSVCFLSAFEVNNILLTYHTTFGFDKQNILVPLIESDILFIDDLGTEPMINNVTINYLFLILSERDRLGRPVIITTNLMPDNIALRYGERIYSRLMNKQTSSIFKIDGSDLRVHK